MEVNVLGVLMVGALLVGLILWPFAAMKDRRERGRKSEEFLDAVVRWYEERDLPLPKRFQDQLDARGAGGGSEEVLANSEGKGV